MTVVVEVFWRLLGILGDVGRFGASAGGGVAGNCKGAKLVALAGGEGGASGWVGGV